MTNDLARVLRRLQKEQAETPPGYAGSFPLENASAYGLDEQQFFDIWCELERRELAEPVAAARRRWRLNNAGMDADPDAL